MPQLLWFKLWLGIGVLSILGYGIYNKEIKILPWKLTLPFIIWLASGIVSWWINSLQVARIGGEETKLMEFIQIVLAIYIFLLIKPEEKEVGWLKAVTIIIVIYAILQFLGIEPLQWKEQGWLCRKSFSTLGNPNFLANYLVLLLPLFIPASWNDWLGVIAFLLVVAALGFTLSRGAWISIALILGIYYFLSSKKEIRIGILLSFLSLLFIVWFKKDVFISEKFFQPNSWETRYSLWTTAFKIILHYPIFGIGIDRFAYYYLKYRSGGSTFLLTRLAFPTSSHNQYLDLAMYCGLIGLLAFGYILVSLLVSGDRNDWRAYMGLGAGLVNALFIFIVPSVWLVFALLLSKIYSGEKIIIKVHSWLILFLFFAFAYGWVWGLSRDVSLCLANYYYFKAEKYFVNRHFISANALMDKALALAPYGWNLWLVKGKWAEERGKLEEALESYLTTIKLNPMNPYPYADLGRLFSKCGERGANVSIYYWKEALKRDPSNVIFLQDLGNTYLSLKEFDKAKECFGKIITLTPRYGYGYFLLGKTAECQKNWKEAKKYLLGAIFYAPNLKEAYILLSKIYLKEGNLFLSKQCERKAKSIKNDE